MIFWVAPEVIEDALLPEPLHGIPILHLKELAPAQINRKQGREKKNTSNWTRQYTAGAPTWPLRMG
jgi:hypothetical protein